MDFFTNEITQTRGEQLVFAVAVALITASIIWGFKKGGLWMKDISYEIKSKNEKRRIKNDRDELAKKKEYEFLFPQERLKSIEYKVRNTNNVPIGDLVFLEKLEKDGRLDNVFLKEYYNSVNYKISKSIASIGKAEDYIKF